LEPNHQDCNNAKNQEFIVGQKGEIQLKEDPKKCIDLAGK
jgi:hypothetical protein